MLFDDYVINWMKQNLESVNRMASIGIRSLEDQIAFLMKDDIDVSEFILQKALLRYPSYLIGKIKDLYPKLK